MKIVIYIYIYNWYDSFYNFICCELSTLTSDFCYIKVIVDFRLEVNLYDSTRDDLAVNPPGSKPIMYHLYFRTDANKAGVDTYTPNGGWHFDGSTLTVVPSPVQYGKTYNITLESHTGFIRVCWKFSTKFTVTYLSH
jgi:hypothetical protein